MDAWGDIPDSEAQQLVKNTAPHYDKGADIYAAITQLLTDSITDPGATTSTLAPGSNSVIDPDASFANVKANWIKLANTLKLRIFLHYSKKDPAFAVAQMTSLINSAGVTFMASIADNFQMAFFNAVKQQNPIQQFESSRSNYLFANDAMVSLMNGKADPRRPFYFTPLPFNSSPATYKGVKPGDRVGTSHSRIHTYLRGSATGSPTMQTGGGITALISLYRRSAR